MQKLFKIIFYPLIPLAMISVTYAVTHESIKWVASSKAVENLNQSIEYVKKNTNLPVLFPDQIPEIKNTKLFASQNSFYEKPDYNRYWEISVGTEPGCQARVCKLGSISAGDDIKLELKYTQAPFGSDNKPILKQKVKLENNITGYYTPGHPEADYHAPTLEWQKNHVLYVLTWQIEKDAKSVLTKMANTAIQSAN